MTVTTNNFLTRNTGSLVLAKELTGGPEEYTGPFDIYYDCGIEEFDSHVTVDAGDSETVSGISAWS